MGPFSPRINFYKEIALERSSIVSLGRVCHCVFGSKEKVGFILSS